nr:MMPL family transporter [Actinomycetota bacterium]
AYQTYDQVRDAFGAGVNGPIVAVAELDEPLPEGDPARSAKQADIGEALFELPDVEYVLPFGVSGDRQTLAFQVVPTGGPTEQSTVDLVQTLDDTAAEIGEDNGATLGLTGQTVANIDISQQLADALPVYLALVIGLSLLLLLLVFRSVVIPVLATAGFLLSVGAAFGAVVAVYQWGQLSWLFGVNEPGPILSFLPILLIGVLFGLAMDYQLFLVSAMRESHAHGEPARRAVISGFNHSARVVVAAAVIMISVFGGFVFAELAMIRPVGLGLAVGVLVDAFVVRMTLTPAVMGLLGERAWYLPRWLDRLLPDVDVEGAALEPSHRPTSRDGREDDGEVSERHPEPGQQPEAAQEEESVPTRA